MNAAAISLTLLAGVNSCIGNVLLKMSRQKLPPHAGIVTQFIEPHFIGGVLFYVFNVMLFAKALDGIAVAVAYPILATTGFALLALASHYIFSETLTMPQYAGLGLAIVGIVLLASGQ